MERSERDLRGEVIDGRFRVEDKLGSGGMGTVWRVQHVVSLQAFALKTLDPSCATEEATRRFLQEARSAAALKTRHVVRVVDADMQHEHQGGPLPFLVMELLEGKNLQQVLDERGTITPAEVAWMAGQLGRALDAAHKQGIVHRDLKPSNVFIAEDEEGQPIVKLCDFGIAKLTGEASALADQAGMPTRTGALLGTPMYLAPELLRGSGAAVPPTDQWSLGLVAFRALAGVEYFAHVRGFPDLVLNIANDPLVAPSQRAFGLPRAFDAWFLRSCARRPEQRFADVPAQVAALEQALGRPAPKPIALRGGIDAAAANAATIAPPASHAGGAPRRRGRTLVLAGAVAWGVCALAALGWLAARGQRHVQPTIAPTETHPAPALTAAPAVPPAPPSAEASSLPPPKESAAPAPKESAAPAAPSGMIPAHLAGPAAPAAPAPPVAAPPPAAAAPAHRRHAARAHQSAAAAPTPKAVTPKAVTLLPKGAACQRSSECASGLCAAETCL